MVVLDLLVGLEHNLDLFIRVRLEVALAWEESELLLVANIPVEAHGLVSVVG